MDLNGKQGIRAVPGLCPPSLVLVDPSHAVRLEDKGLSRTPRWKLRPSQHFKHPSGSLGLEVKGQILKRQGHSQSGLGMGRACWEFVPRARPCSSPSPGPGSVRSITSVTQRPLCRQLPFFSTAHPKIVHRGTGARNKRQKGSRLR